VGRTQVAIIGAGPSGLLLGQLLLKEGIDNVVLERQSGEYVLSRIRAGIIETVTVDLLKAAGVEERMHRESLVHDGIELCFAGARHRVDFRELVGRSVVVYGQTEITRDLMSARSEAGGTSIYEAQDVRPHDIASASPRVTYRHKGREQSLDCDFVVGCDGFHGVSRASIPHDVLSPTSRIRPRI